MPRRVTREKKYIKLPERRIEEIKALAESWPYETKAFMRSRLNQYQPNAGIINKLAESMVSFFMPVAEKHFEILKDPDILTDWQARFEVSGQSNPQEAWNKILEK